MSAVLLRFTFRSMLSSQQLAVQNSQTLVCALRFHYTMMAWLPSYFADTLSLSLTQAAQLSLLPPVAAIVASSIAGTAGDALISKGMPVVQVRKLAQCTAFLGPALCLAGASLTDDSHLKVGQSPFQAPAALELPFCKPQPGCGFVHRCLGQ